MLLLRHQLHSAAITTRPKSHTLVDKKQNAIPSLPTCRADTTLVGTVAWLHGCNRNYWPCWVARIVLICPSTFKPHLPNPVALCAQTFGAWDNNLPSPSTSSAAVSDRVSRGVSDHVSMGMSSHLSGTLPKHIANHSAPCISTCPTHRRAAGWCIEFAARHPARAQIESGAEHPADRRIERGAGRRVEGCIQAIAGHPVGVRIEPRTSCRRAYRACCRPPCRRMYRSRCRPPCRRTYRCRCRPPCRRAYRACCRLPCRRSNSRLKIASSEPSTHAPATPPPTPINTCQYDTIHTAHLVGVQVLRARSARLLCDIGQLILPSPHITSHLQAVEPIQDFRTFPSLTARAEDGRSPALALKLHSHSVQPVFHRGRKPTDPASIGVQA
jgi:hypothetical protein